MEPPTTLGRPPPGFAMTWTGEEAWRATVVALPFKHPPTTKPLLPQPCPAGSCQPAPKSEPLDQAFFAPTNSEVTSEPACMSVDADFDSGVELRKGARMEQHSEEFGMAVLLLDASEQGE